MSRRGMRLVRNDERRNTEKKMDRYRSKSGRVALVKQLITGTAKHYPDGSQSLSIGGATITVNALTQVMQDFVSQRDAVEAAKAAAKTKIENEQTRTPSQLAVIRAFEKFVRGTFGNSAEVLAEFGLVPHKAPDPGTAEQKAVAVAKRNATRAARHTMGKIQKKDVNGAVEARLVVTPLGDSTPRETPAQAPGGTPPPSPPPAGGTTPRVS